MVRLFLLHAIVSLVTLLLLGTAVSIAVAPAGLAVAPGGAATAVLAARPPMAAAAAASKSTEKAAAPSRCSPLTPVPAHIVRLRSKGRARSRHLGPGPCAQRR